MAAQRLDCGQNFGDGPAGHHPSVWL